MLNPEEYIYYFAENEIDEFVTKSGWYFSDETEQLQGPFETIEEVKKNLNDYAKWLKGEIDEK